MHFSQIGAVALACMSGLVSGQHAVAKVRRTGHEAAKLQAAGAPLSCDVALGQSWDHSVLLAGEVDTPIADLGLAVGVLGQGHNGKVPVGVALQNSYTKGGLKIALNGDNVLAPLLRVDLSGIEAFLDIDAQLGATTIALNLFAHQDPLLLGLPILNLGLGLEVYLDLVLSVSNPLDFAGGLFVSIAQGAYVEVNVLTGEIVNSVFPSVGSKGLPFIVRAGSGTVQADLRLRIAAAAKAEIDLDLLDLNLLGQNVDLLDIGAGIELGLFINLLEHKVELGSGPGCALQAVEKTGLNIGAIVKVDVEVEDLLSLQIAPLVSTTLLVAPPITRCLAVSAPTGTATVTLSTASSSSVASSSAAVTSSSVAATGPITSGTAAPTGPSNGTAPGTGLVTSTVYQTDIYTITSCAASVPNCPGEYQTEVVVTKTVDVYTTICPATATITAPPKTSSKPAPANSASYPASSEKVTTVVTDVTVLVPCTTSNVETFHPPTNVPTYPAQKPTTSAPAPVYPTTSAKVPEYPTTSVKVPTYPAGTPSSKGPEYPTGTPEVPKYPVTTTVKPSLPGTGITYTTTKRVNTTLASITSTISKPSAGLPTTTLTYPVAPPATTTPVTAGAGRAVAGGFAGVLAVIAGLAMF